MSNHRKIDAGKRIAAACSALRRVCAMQDFSVKGDKNSAHCFTSKTNRIEQIFLCIGILRLYGNLRAGQHNRLIEMPQHCGQCCGAVRHGIRAMRKHKAVISVIVLCNGLRQDTHALWVHVGAVNAHNRNAGQLTQG